jgi:hypothetical protein
LILTPPQPANILQTESYEGTRPEPASKYVHELRPRNSEAMRHVRLTKTAALNFIAEISANGKRRDARRPSGKIMKRRDATAKEVEIATPRQEDNQRRNNTDRNDGHTRIQTNRRTLHMWVVFMVKA